MLHFSWLGWEWEEFYPIRSHFVTPVVGVLFLASGVLLLSLMSFQEIIALENYLYYFHMFLEFSASIWLRIKNRTMSRPYKFPLRNMVVNLKCIPPLTLLCLVFPISLLKVMIVNITVVFIGFIFYLGLEYLKNHKQMMFLTHSIKLEIYLFMHCYFHLIVSYLFVYAFLSVT